MMQDLQADSHYDFDGDENPFEEAQSRKPIDYYKEAVRLYYYNCVLYNHFEKVVSERNDLKSKLLKFQALEGEYLQQDSDHLIQELEEKRKRNRRGASEIQRNFICSVDNCHKAYGSEGSLMQHMKIKHGKDVQRQLKLLQVKQSISSGFSNRNTNSQNEFILQLKSKISFESLCDRIQALQPYWAEDKTIMQVYRHIFTLYKSQDFKQNSGNVHSFKPQYYVPQQQKMSNIHDLQQNNLVRNAPRSRDFKKTIPRNIHQDKERLYEELNQSKSQNNHLMTENHKLKSKIQTLEEELGRISAKYSSTNEPTAGLKQMLKAKKNPQQEYLVPNCMTVTLKKQVKELQEELEEKEEEMGKIKRNVKLTRIQEIEAELKVYQDETMRLKRMLQQCLRMNTNMYSDNNFVMLNSKEID